MIAATVEELTPIIGTRPACRRWARQWRRVPSPEAARAENAQAAADTGEGADSARAPASARRAHSERFVDVFPEETYATLLDEGTDLARCERCTGSSPATTAVSGAARSAHPPALRQARAARHTPERAVVLGREQAERSVKWTWFYLYVILDVFSRYIVGWTVQYRENAQLAMALIEQATEQQQITPKILTLHADRGAPQRAKPVAFLLADLGITKTHSRPYTSSDKPYSESNFKTLKYRPEFPAGFDDIDRARGHCRVFVDWYNHVHRHSGIGLMTPAAVHHGHAKNCMPTAPSCSMPPTSSTRNGLSASCRSRGSCRPPPGSTSRPIQRRSRRNYTKASHRA